MKCSRCGDDLKEVEVKVPVKPRTPVTLEENLRLLDLPTYETRREYADCPRCTGGY